MILFMKFNRGTCMQEAADSPQRKPGRPKSGHTVAKFTVMLPPWLHDWAMQHPEGFTGLVRRLLLEAHNRSPNRTPVARHRARQAAEAGGKR